MLTPLTILIGTMVTHRLPVPALAAVLTGLEVCTATAAFQAVPLWQAFLNGDQPIKFGMIYHGGILDDDLSTPLALW